MFLPTNPDLMPVLVYREIDRREKGIAEAEEAARRARPPRAARRAAGQRPHFAIRDEAVHWFDSPIGPDHPPQEAQPFPKPFPKPYSGRERCDLLRVAWERYPNAANDSVALVWLYHEGMTPEGKARFDATDWPAL